MPLMRKPALLGPAKRLFDGLSRHMVAEWDQAGSIGRRYRRQDEAGTPHVVTVDYDTLDDATVTVRDRDTMAQRRVSASSLLAYLREAHASAPASDGLDNILAGDGAD